MTLRPGTLGRIGVPSQDGFEEGEDDLETDALGLSSPVQPAPKVRGLSCALQLLLLVMVTMGVIAAYAAAKTPPGSSRAGVPPSPPTPYEYDSFMQWFRTQQWSDLGLPVAPELDWFDVDGALVGKRRAWFDGGHGPGEPEAVAVAKGINRYLFMEGVMLSGLQTVMGTLPMHLLILKLLRHDLPTAKLAVDAGCGTGWLVEAFHLMGAAEVIGFDIDPKEVEEATRLLSHPQATAAGLVTLQGAAPRLLDGNLLGGSVGHSLHADSVDVLNLGAALENSPDGSAALRRLGAYLRPGGALTVPICVAPKESDGICSAEFKLLRRPRDGGDLIPEGQTYSVRFIVASRS